MPASAPETRPWRCPQCNVDYQIPALEPEPMACQKCAPQKRKPAPRPAVSSQPHPALIQPPAAEPSKAFQKVLSAGGVVVFIARAIVWIAFIINTQRIIAGHNSMALVDDSSPKQAARAAQSTFQLLCGFAIARAIDLILRR